VKLPGQAPFRKSGDLKLRASLHLDPNGFGLCDGIYRISTKGVAIMGIASRASNSSTRSSHRLACTSRRSETVLVVRLHWRRKDLDPAVNPHLAPRLRRFAPSLRASPRRVLQGSLYLVIAFAIADWAGRPTGRSKAGRLFRARHTPKRDPR